jgi:hypothetical protein
MKISQEHHLAWVSHMPSVGATLVKKMEKFSENCCSQLQTGLYHLKDPEND